jgi:hypothetical protein
MFLDFAVIRIASFRLHAYGFFRAFFGAYAAPLAESQVNNKGVIFFCDTLRRAKGHAYAATITYLIIDDRS